MYKNIDIVKKDTKIKKIKDFEYAKNLTQSIITIDEFFKASNSLPIFFLDDKAIVLLGLKENSFIDSDNKWKKGEYIPFYIRRYPFNFFQKDDKFILVYDTDAKGDEKIDIDSILEKMKEYQLSYNKTEKFIEKLKELELLKEVELSINKNNQKYIIKSLKQIDEEKLNNLDDDKKVELVNSGFYKLIIAHLLSLNNVQKLL